MKSHKWAYKIVLGGLLGTVGVLIARGFPYFRSGWNYHIDPIQYLRPFSIGVLVGLVAGVVERDLKKLYVIPLVSGFACALGHFLWRQLLESGQLGEAAVIVGPIFSVILLGGAVSGGVGIGQALMSPVKISLGRNIWNVFLRMLCCSLLCLISIGLFYGKWIVSVAIFGFILGAGTYLIGETHD